MARKLGVTIDSILAWEKDRKEPEYRYCRRIIAFLGYDPGPVPQNLGEELRAKYRELGLPRKEVARRVGLDENTLRYYERGNWMPTTARARRIIEALLGCSDPMQLRSTRS